MFKSISIRSGMIGATLVGLMALSHTAYAADRDKDPYLAGFERYAQENSELAGAIDSYKEELKKVMQEKPELNEGQQGGGH